MDTPYRVSYCKSDREGEISYDIPYMWNLKSNDTHQFTYETERLTDLENELMVASSGGEVICSSGRSCAHCHIQHG